MCRLESIVAVIGLIAIIGIVVWLALIAPLLKWQENKPQPIPSNAPFETVEEITPDELVSLVDSAQAEQFDTTAWPRFTNMKYGYSFQYPPGITFEGWTSTMNRTNPEVADKISLTAQAPPSALYAALFFQISGYELSLLGEQCEPGHKKESIEEFIQKLQEESQKINNNVPRVIPVSYQHISGSEIELTGMRLFQGCLREDYNQIFDREIFWFFQEDDVRIEISHGVAEERGENPLVRAILDTLRFE